MLFVAVFRQGWCTCLLGEWLGRHWKESCHGLRLHEQVHVWILVWVHSDIQLKNWQNNSSLKLGTSPGKWMTMSFLDKNLGHIPSSGYQTWLYWASPVLTCSLSWMFILFNFIPTFYCHRRVYSPSMGWENQLFNPKKCIALDWIWGSGQLLKRFKMRHYSLCSSRRLWSWEMPKKISAFLVFWGVNG